MAFNYEFPQRLDLDKYNVYLEQPLNDTSYIFIDKLPNVLTYGKHTFKLSINDPKRDLPNNPFDDAEQWLRDNEVRWTYLIFGKPRIDGDVTAYHYIDNHKVRATRYKEDSVWGDLISTTKEIKVL